jgi:hypothetical protein
MMEMPTCRSGVLPHLLYHSANQQMIAQGGRLHQVGTVSSPTDSLQLRKEIFQVNPAFHQMILMKIPHQ